MTTRNTSGFTNDLAALHGELLKGAALRRALGYGSARSFYRAVADQTTPVPIFKIAGRFAWCARTREVVDWLSSLGRSPVGPSTDMASCATEEGKHAR